MVRDFKDAAAAARREGEAVGDHFVALLIRRAELVDVSGLHLTIGVQALLYRT